MKEGNKTNVDKEQTKSDTGTVTLLYFLAEAIKGGTDSLTGTTTTTIIYCASDSLPPCSSTREREREREPLLLI